MQYKPHGSEKATEQYHIQEGNGGGGIARREKEKQRAGDTENARRETLRKRKVMLPVLYYCGLCGLSRVALSLSTTPFEALTTPRLLPPFKSLLPNALLVGLGLIKAEKVAVADGRNKARMLALDRPVPETDLGPIFKLLLHAAAQGTSQDQEKAWDLCQAETKKHLGKRKIRTAPITKVHRPLKRKAKAQDENLKFERELPAV